MIIKTFKNTALAATFAISMFFWFAIPSYAVGLKQNVELGGDVIMLGDIFYDLPRDQSRVLGPAPRPGTDMVLNARTLLKIAIALDLPWRPTSSSDQIVLKRAASLIDKTMIENRIITEMKSRGQKGDFELSFPGETAEIILPVDQPATFDITKLTIDEANGVFQASISAPSKENAIRNSHISGKIYRVINIPVLRDTIRHGTVISKNDIDYITVREHQIGQGTIVSSQSLIGMTPRRVAFSGRALLANEIEAPIIVDRGDSVTLILKNNAMTLTASGRSLEDGAKGDLVRVVNSSSSRTIQGFVTGDQEVTIDSF